MKNNSTDKNGDDFFKVKIVNHVALIELQDFPLRRLIQIEQKEKVFSLLRQIENQKSIKILLLVNSHHKMQKEGYIKFIRMCTENRLDMTKLLRFYNAMNQLILRIIHFSKIIIHVDNGVIMPPFLNISLASDYRIVGDKTIFRNPNLELDLPPKGGGVYFLSKKLGHSKTIEFLMSERDVTAEEAKELGIVNRIISSDNLTQEALLIAQEFANKPAHFMTGIKKLLNWNFDEVKAFLEHENDILLKSIKYRND